MKLRQKILTVSVSALCALLLALASLTSAIDLKPHPLFGDPILGNSAEVFRIWQKSYPEASLFMQAVDFDGQNTTLLAGPECAVPGGASEDRNMQQMATACGDFDGNNKDDIVIGFSSDHDPLGNFQDLNLMVPQIDPESLELIPGEAVEHGLVMSRRAEPGMGYTSPKNIRLAAGNFYAGNDISSGTNIEEFVLGTRVPAGFCGNLRAYDYFGTSQAVLEDLDGDGNRELAVGVPADDDGGLNRGAVWILFLDDTGNVRYQQKISQLRGGFMGILNDWDQFGVSLASLGDCDGDGVGDLAVGVPGASDDGLHWGTVWVLYLNSDGTVKDQERIKSPPGLHDNDYFGSAVEMIGDLDRNGTEELAVGAAGDDDLVEDGGAVWILFREADGSVSGYSKISGTEGSFAGPLHAGDELTYADALAWLDDHNISGALAVGAWLDDDGGSNRGAVWILFLDTNGQVQSQTKISHTSGNLGGSLYNEDCFGRGIACLESDDQAGNLQLAVGIPFHDNPLENLGAVWLLSLAADGSVDHHRELDILSEVTTPAPVAGDFIGCSVVSLGDLDGNGFDDLAVGASGADAGESPFVDEGSVRILGLADDGTDVSIIWDDRHDANGQADIQVELMELVGGQPTTLATAFVEHSNFSLLGSARFDVAAGDFDLDGIDEIVVVGYRDVIPYQEQEIFFKIFAYDHVAGVLVERDLGETGQAPLTPMATPDGHFAGIYLDRIELATGPLDPASARDQIVLAEEQRWAGGSSGNMYASFECRFIPISVIINPNDPDDWALQWHTGGQTAFATSYDHCFGSAPTSPNDWYYWITGTSLGVELADLNVDGAREIVAAGLDKVCVYQTSVDESGNVSCSLVAEEPRSLNFNISASPFLAADLDAQEVAVSGGMWRPEIILTETQYDLMWLKGFVAALDSSQVPPAITGLDPLFVWEDESHVWFDGVLACGDFDGDGVRVGGPTHHHLNDVIQPLVILNRPPVHYDVLEGQGYDPAGCFPGWECNCFYSVYTESNEQELSLEQEVHSDWGVGAGINSSWSFLGFGLSVSMETSYGRNFSRTEASTQTITTSLTYAATDWPEYRATILEYDIWEYPVHAGGEILGHMAVTRPEVSQASSTWLSYNAMPMHSLPFPYDPNNILSYPSEVPTDIDPEVGEIWFSDSFVISEGTAPDCLNGTLFDWTNVEQEVETDSWDFGVEVSATGSYGATSVNVNGHYGRGEISTHSTTVTNSFTIENHFDKLVYNEPGDPEWTYEVLPYIYRSTTGALILHYAVEPYFGQPGDDTIWETVYDENPDPAFLLPFYHDIHGVGGQRLDSRYLSPDVRLMPYVAAWGDTVVVEANVHNLSLMVQPDPVEVRFYVGDPDEVMPFPIEDTAGHSVWQTGGGIAVRDTGRVQIVWVVPETIPENPRIFAVLTPQGSAGEINTFNNKGYATLVAPGATSGVEEVGSVARFSLAQNHPNPFNPVTEIRFSLGAPGATKLCIYDVSGRRVATLVDEQLRVGTYVKTWDGRCDDGKKVSSGVYLYRLETPTYTEVRRMVLLK